MRLINTHTMQLEEHHFEDVIQEYAILSHTWGKQEVSYQEYIRQDESIRALEAYQKIVKFCEIARSHSLGYAWVDTW